MLVQKKSELGILFGALIIVKQNLFSNSVNQILFVDSWVTIIESTIYVSFIYTYVKSAIFVNFWMQTLPLFLIYYWYQKLAKSALLQNSFKYFTV